MPTYSYLATPSATREVLARHGLATKHRLGQNFLVSDAVIGKILGLAELGDADVVYEIGPGIGTLTVAMLSRAGAVVAVEADRELPPVLRETCEAYGERLALVQGDALRVRPEELGEALAGLDIEGLACAPTKLVANLPYQVAATVILGTFEQQPQVERAVVMVQAEVADRIAATPGSKAYGAYTAKLALFGRVTGRFEVGPGNFVPPPHVDSAVVRIERAPMPDPRTGAVLSREQVAWTARVIDAAFAQRRKTIRNSMGASGFDKASLDAAFSHVGMDAGSRAERLAPQDFVRLAGALRELDGNA